MSKQYRSSKDRAQEELDVMLSPQETGTGEQPQENGDPAQQPAAEITPQVTPEPSPAEPQQTQLDPAQQQPSQAQTPDDPIAVLTQRFETLQGKYNAEVPRLNALLRDKVAENARLKSQISSSQETAPTAIDGTAYKKLVDEYGQDSADAIIDIVRGEAGRIAAKTSETVTRQHVEPLAHDIQDQQRIALHDRIDALAGKDWISVNNSPDFVAWTQNNVDRYSGKPFIELLNTAYAAGDANTVATFFIDFKAAATQGQPTQTQQTTPELSHQQTQVTDQQAMVAPARRATSVQTVTDGSPDKVFSMAEVEDFYSELARPNQGKYRGKPELVAQMESDINSAFQTGRVV